MKKLDVGVYVYQECPYCGIEQTFLFETDELDKPKTYTTVSLRKRLNSRTSIIKSEEWLETARVNLPDQNFISGEFECRSIKCKYEADLRDIILQGWPGYYGRFSKGKIRIRRHEGKQYLVGTAYDLVSDNLNTTVLRNWRKFLPKTVLERYKEFKKYDCYNQDCIALRMFCFKNYESKIELFRNELNITLSKMSGYLGLDEEYAQRFLSY